jgi:hypothetical protein
LIRHRPPWNASSNEIITLFEQLLPDFNQWAFQAKQWWLRLETDDCKIMFASHIPLAIAETFEKERIPVKKEAKTDELLKTEISPLDVRFLLNRDPPQVHKRELC